MTGPQLLMQEVPSIAFDTRGDRVRLLVGGRSEHWGPTVFRSDDLGETWDETTNGAIRFPADTGVSLERVWQLTPDSPQRPDVVWAGCEPTSLWRSTDGGASFELVRGLWDHPHRPQWAPGFGGAAVHTVLPDPASDRVLVAMSTGGVYASDDGSTRWTPSNTGISAYFLPDPQPEFGQCVHKVARSRRADHAVRPEPPRGLPVGRQRKHLAVDRRRAAQRLRLRRHGTPAHAGYGLGDPAEGGRRTRAARRPAARAPHP